MADKKFLESLGENLSNLKSYIYEISSSKDMDVVKENASMALEVIARIGEESTKFERGFTDLENYFEYSPISLILLDTDGKILDASPTFQKILGKSINEIRGMPIEQIYPKVNQKEAKEEIVNQTLKHGEMKGFESSILEREGRENSSVWYCKADFL